MVDGRVSYRNFGGFGKIQGWVSVGVRGARVGINAITAKRRGRVGQGSFGAGAGWVLCWIDAGARGGAGVMGMGAAAASPGRLIFSLDILKRGLRLYRHRCLLTSACPRRRMLRKIMLARCQCRAQELMSGQTDFTCPCCRRRWQS